MQDDTAFDDITSVYYEQIEKLGILHEDFTLPYRYVKKLFRFFFCRCIRELKRLKKLDNTFDRKDYRVRKRLIIKQFSRLNFKELVPSEEISEQTDSKELSVNEDNLPENN